MSHLKEFEKMTQQTILEFGASRTIESVLDSLEQAGIFCSNNTAVYKVTRILAERYGYAKIRMTADALIESTQPRGGD